MSQKINIAIDGYSSCGKSTIAKALAKRLGYTYIDSGAMYRAITLYMINHNIHIDDERAVEEALKQITIDIHTSNKGNIIYLNGEDVSAAIREMYVANMVSEVAAIGIVRKKAVAQQRAMGAQKGVIMDGREIGSVVFPDAELKIFMTADPEVRAQRRYQELKATNPNITIEEVKANLSHRDHIDTTREIDPLVQTADARVLDNSNMTQDEQLSLVESWVNAILKDN